MSGKKVLSVLKQLKAHAPFTFFGAMVGLLCMFAIRGIGYESSEKLFKVFHPLHVVLSAMVTAALFRANERRKHFLMVLFIGYFGSVGVATLSDCVIPFFGENILGAAFPSHVHHHHEHFEQTSGPEQQSLNAAPEFKEYDVDVLPHLHQHYKSGLIARMHLGFIEEWYLVTPAALLGVLIAYFMPKTKFPHAAHVLISTWASSAHIMMSLDTRFSVTFAFGMLMVLFIAVWIPCCISDIVFPMLFVNNGNSN